MSKPVKNLITEAYKKKFAGIDGAVLIDVRGVPSNDNNQLRAALKDRGIKVTVVKNNLARLAFEGTPMQDIGGLLEGPSAVVYGGSSVVEVARELIQHAKKIEKLTFKGALMDGTLFTAEQIDELSKYPTREEAQAQVVQIILSPARNLAGAIAGPGAKLASIIKAIEEKLEKGETISKSA